MNEPPATLEDLLVEIRKNAKTERDFAQRIALACAEIAARADKAHRNPAAAIRAAFELG